MRLPAVFSAVSLVRGAAALSSMAAAAAPPPVPSVDALYEEAPPAPYRGPTPAGGTLKGVRASLEVAGGLVLEVGPSTIPDGGLGLFVRCGEGADSVSVAAGVAVCGYGRGSFRTSPSTEGGGAGKAVAYALRDERDAVWFERELQEIGELLRRPDVVVAGHALREEEPPEGGDFPLALVDDWPARYYVPDPLLPQGAPPLNALDLGQFANDLNYSRRRGTAAAVEPPEDDDNNLLVLVMRLERSAENPELLVPTRPISTLARDVTFDNAEPMELGCTYGDVFWDNFDKPTAR